MWLDRENKPITNIDQLPDNAFGFVYVIENITKKKIYVGKKNLFTKRKRKFGKKEIEALKDKRAKKYEYVIKESNWLAYTGSNKELNDDIRDGDEIKKHLIQVAFSAAHLTYLETKYQFILEVLEKDSYNDSILGKFYRKIFDF